MHVVSLLLVLAVLVACGAAVHGPVSRFARGYVAEMLVDAVAPEQDEDGDGEHDEQESLVLRAAAGRRWFLLPHWQTALFLVVAGGACAVALSAGRWFEAVAVMPVLAALTVAGSTDGVCHRLPNRLLGPAALWAAACVVVEVVARLAAGGGLARALAPVGGSLAATAGLGAVTLLLALLPSGLGMGDVKLCTLIGLWLGRFGWAVPVAGVVAGLFIAGVVAIALMVLRRAQRHTMIAMGPYLIVGAVAAWALAVA